MAIVNNWEATQHAHASILTTAIHLHFRVNSRHSYPSSQRWTSVQLSESLLRHEQQRTTFPSSHWYSNITDSLISSPVTHFLAQRLEHLPTTNDVFLFRVSSCDGDQFETYRWRIFVGSSSVPVIGEYLSFSVTSDIAAISLFPVVLSPTLASRRLPLLSPPHHCCSPYAAVLPRSCHPGAELQCYDWVSWPRWLWPKLLYV
jgi:hypothetical protein